MTVLMKDAVNSLSVSARRAWDTGELSETLFADDTLLISSSGPHLESYMAAVEKHGADYGLQIHWGKVHLVPVSTQQPVHAPNGTVIAAQTSMIYLGATVHGSGRFGSEVARKIGHATADFNQLLSVWRQTSLSVQRKFKLFESLVLSKLLYGVASAWLLKADLRRLDGFHARCLRKLLKVKAAFISRISNERVRQMAGVQPLSSRVDGQQQKLLQQVLNDPDKAILRDAAFQQGSNRPLTDRFIRRVGRPRQNWTDQVLKAALLKRELANE